MSVISSWDGRLFHQTFFERPSGKCSIFSPCSIAELFQGTSNFPTIPAAHPHPNLRDPRLLRIKGGFKICCQYVHSCLPTNQNHSITAFKKEKINRRAIERGFQEKLPRLACTFVGKTLISSLAQTDLGKLKQCTRSHELNVATSELFQKTFCHITFYTVALIKKEERKN